MSSTNVGSIHYDLSLDKTKFDQTQAQVSGTLKEAGSKMVTFGKVAAAAFGAAAIAGTTFAVKSSASFEQTRIGLENMLGSADAARVMLSKISKFAAETPFEFPELAQAARQLVAFGFNGEQAFQTMKNLGDVSAAVGAPINDLAYLMGTLKTQGRAFTIDLRQFAQRGIPIYEYLAKVLKTNEKAITEMVEQGKIGFPEVEKAFALMTAEGGKFHGAMETQSKSLNGLWSTMKDNIGQVARKMVGLTETGDIVQGGLFDKIKTGVETILPLLEQVPAMMEQSFGQMAHWIGVARVEIEKVAGIINSLFGPSVGALFRTIRDDVLPPLERLWKALNPGLTEAIKIVVGILVGIFVAQLWIFTNVLNVVWATIGHVIDRLAEVGRSIGNFAGVVINGVNSIIGWFSRLPGGIQAALATVGAIIAAPFLGAFTAIALAWNRTLGKINFTVPEWVPGLGGKGFRMPTIPTFDTGGVVPGPVGKAQLALVHGGETILPTHKRDYKQNNPVGNTTIYGNVSIGNRADADYFFDRLNRQQDALGMGLSGAGA